MSSPLLLAGFDKHNGHARHWAWRAPAAAARGDNYIPPAFSVWALSSMPILILGRS